MKVIAIASLLLAGYVLGTVTTTIAPTLSSCIPPAQTFATLVACKTETAAPLPSPSPRPSPTLLPTTTFTQTAQPTQRGLNVIVMGTDVSCTDPCVLFLYGNGQAATPTRISP